MRIFLLLASIGIAALALTRPKSEPASMVPSDIVSAVGSASLRVAELGFAPAVEAVVRDELTVSGDREPSRAVVPSTPGEREAFVMTVLAPHGQEVTLAKYHDVVEKTRRRLRDDLTVSERNIAESLIAELASAKTTYVHTRYRALEDYVRNTPNLADAKRVPGQRGYEGELRRGLTDDERAFWGGDVGEVRIDFFLGYDSYPALADARRGVARIRREVDGYCR